MNNELALRVLADIREAIDRPGVTPVARLHEVGRILDAAASSGGAR